MMRKPALLLVSPLVVAVCTVLGVYLASFTWGSPGKVELTVYAQRYSFDPPIITVNKGDKVSINLITRDVTHGFFLEGHDIDAKIQPNNSAGDDTLMLRHPSKGDEFREVDRITFVANKPGKFRYRCSQTCGYMHPFMLGELIVRPNYPFWGGVGFMVGVAVATLLLLVGLAKGRERGAPLTDTGDADPTLAGATDEG